MGSKWAALGLLVLSAGVSGAEVPSPEACTLITAADVNAVLGGGFKAAANLATGKTGSESSSCLYSKDARSTAAVFVLRAPGGDAKQAVLARQETQRRSGRSVTAIPGVCDVAFLLVLSPQRTNLIAGKGSWQLETEVNVAGTPDASAAQKLAGLACSRLP